jgi:hypothetical protein
MEASIIRMWRRCGLLDVIVVRSHHFLFFLKAVDAYFRPRTRVDVGGGAVRNEVRNNLARISLRWMVRECFKLKTGILFHQEAFATIGMDYNMLWPQVKPRPPPVTTFSKGHPPPLTRPFHTTGVNHTARGDDYFVNEEEEDLADALSPINDMLQIAKSWWLLELVPQQIRFQTDEDSWVRKLSCVASFEM